MEPTVADHKARGREHRQGGQSVTCTSEQLAALARIKLCQAKDHYSVLSIAINSNQQQIRQAYYKQSLLTHPDKCNHSSAEEAFKRVAEAFAVLRDTELRKQFDSVRDYQSAGQQDSWSWSAEDLSERTYYWDEELSRFLADALRRTASSFEEYYPGILSPGRILTVFYIIEVVGILVSVLFL